MCSAEIQTCMTASIPCTSLFYILDACSSDCFCRYGKSHRQPYPPYQLFGLTCSTRGNTISAMGKLTCLLQYIRSWRFCKRDQPSKWHPDRKATTVSTKPLSASSLHAVIWINQRCQEREGATVKAKTTGNTFQCDLYHTCKFFCSEPFKLATFSIQISRKMRQSCLYEMRFLQGNWSNQSVATISRKEGKLEKDWF